MAADPRRSGPASTLGLVLLCLVQGCASLQHSPELSPEIVENLPPAVELTRTPFIPQTRHHCGPAALATVLQSHQIEVAAEALAPYIYIPGRKGSLQIEIAATARGFGALPYPLKPALADLLAEVAAGNPVLVLQNLRFGWWPQWHYAVVVGYSIPEQELILRSGTTERWQTSFDTFAGTWDRAENWALVIVPAGVIPATATLPAYLRSVHAFEQTGLKAYALDSYRAATAHWALDATTWLARGNLAYGMTFHEEAVEALLTAARLAPDDVIAWNNLAYALHQYGCAAAAQKSLRCAYRLSPDDHNVRDSERDIKSMPVKPRAQRCPDIACDSI